MNMARSNSSDPRAGSELRAGDAHAVGARPGNGAEAGVAGAQSGYGAGVSSAAGADTAIPPNSSAVEATDGALNGGLVGSGTKIRSDWQLSRKMSLTMLRHPKSGFLSFWIYFWVPVMIVLQDYEDRDLSTWFLMFSLIIVVGLAPGYTVWEIDRLRALSLSKRVIRFSRLAVSLFHGLTIYLMALGLLTWKLGWGTKALWVVMTVAALLQVSIYLRGWKDAEKISDSPTRKNQWLEDATKNAKNKAGQSENEDEGVSIGVRGYIGRFCSDGDVLLDELTLKPSVKFAKWFVLPLLLITFAGMALSYSISPDPNNVKTFALWAVLTIVMTLPMGQAAFYNQQIINWLAFSGTRSLWWRQHLKEGMLSLWQGPSLILAAFGGYLTGLMCRGVEPAIPLTVGTIAAGVCLGIGMQLALSGLANALTVVLNCLRGWKTAATIFGMYFAFAVVVISVTANSITWVREARGLSTSVQHNQPVDISHVIWQFAGPTMLGLFVSGALLWLFSFWGYKRLSVRGTDGGDIFGTSQ